MNLAVAFRIGIVLVVISPFGSIETQQLGCGVRQIKTRSLITSGTAVQPGDYPWHTAIYQLAPSRQYICGGTLVGQSVVLTSAHCATIPGTGTPRSVSDLAIRVGKHLMSKVSDSEQEHGISSIIIRQGFNGQRHDHDIALLITVQPVKYGKFVQPACLPTFSLISDTTVGTIVGWGYTEKNKVSDVLRSARAPVVSRDVCTRSNPEAFGTTLTEDMFCAGFRNGTNACNGDSGGGFFRNVNDHWFLLGIISFTAAKSSDDGLCSSRDYSVYTDVVKYKRWIRSNSNSSFGNLCPDTRQPVKYKKQYFVHNNREVNFHTAWRLCQSYGHRLATITSEEDSQLIEQAIAKSNNQKGPWFIGGTDLGSEGHFIWISTNKPVGYLSGYFNYSPGQPDNAGGNENCLEIGRWGGVVWNDVPCDWNQRYICEFVRPEY
ncbi:clotting factor G beta subunit-like [Uranotaenia lowii]|uniref:clotting factor G beta subunit-like n=1 Tax=Uranotaenia lowii TaxID=190385 RepID=UPI002478BBDE|nr:clotting factor G beta subunit-like [Uranotaenia lowii]